MELSVSGPVAEWGGQEVRLSMEEDVVYTLAGCHLLDSRQTAFHLLHPRRDLSDAGDRCAYSCFRPSVSGGNHSPRLWRRLPMFRLRMRLQMPSSSSCTRRRRTPSDREDVFRKTLKNVKRLANKRDLNMWCCIPSRISGARTPTGVRRTIHRRVGGRLRAHRLRGVGDTLRLLQ